MVEKHSFRGQEIYFFRDDLYPFVGGGNKARKIEAIAEEIERIGCDAVVTTGGIQSNHCRAVAIMAAKRHWNCKLILHGSKERYKREGGNAQLIRMSSAEVAFAEPASIAASMDAAMETFRQDGLKPYYIYGGGHELKGGEAYVDAVKELQQYCREHQWAPDYIFLASGTGTTQAGIMAGLDLCQLQAAVYGISIGRQRTRAEEVVAESYSALRSALNISHPMREVIVLDDYLAGGYEVYNDQIQHVIFALAKDTGIYTDPTYSGKAFWGMLETIKKEKLSGQFLFWHTGGLLNLLSSNIT